MAEGGGDMEVGMGGGGSSSSSRAPATRSARAPEPSDARGESHSRKSLGATPTPAAADVALGALWAGGRLTIAAGRLAFLSLRAGTRAPGVRQAARRAGETLAVQGRVARARASRQAEQVAQDLFESPQLKRSIDRALAGSLPDAVVRSLVERQVAQRMAKQMVVTLELEPVTAPGAAAQPITSAELERLVTTAVESRLSAQLTQRLVESPELERVIEEVASSPAVRAAMARQTMSLGEEIAAGLRQRMWRADDSLERLARRLLRRPLRSSPTPSAYGGLASRTIAFAADLSIVLVIGLAAAGFLALVDSFVAGIGRGLGEVLLGVGWSLLAGFYFALFWTLAGQTPGMRMMRLRVMDRRGTLPRFGRAVVRLVASVLAIAPLFAGLVPVLFDGRRRALQDFVAGTVVMADDSLSGPAPADRPAPLDPTSAT
jgi:uncharacterized RDD family membrane protein YckC